jgi:hypothetical protein
MKVLAVKKKRKKNVTSSLVHLLCTIQKLQNFKDAEIL